MENKFDFSQQQMDALLQMAGKRMGTDPEKLRDQMQNGQMDSILSSLPADKKTQLLALAQNPAAIEQFMQNPKVQLLIKGLMGK